MKKLVALCGPTLSGKKTIAGVLLTKNWYLADLSTYIEKAPSANVAFQRLLSKIQDIDKDVIIVGIETCELATQVRALNGLTIFLNRAEDKDKMAQGSSVTQETMLLHGICNRHMYNNCDISHAQAELISVIDDFFASR